MKLLSREHRKILDRIIWLPSIVNMLVLIFILLNSAFKEIDLIIKLTYIFTFLLFNTLTVLLIKMKVESSIINPISKGIIIKNDEIVSVSNQLKATEDELIDTLKRHEVLINNLTDLFFIINKEGIIIEINRICKEILGYETSAMIGKPLYKFMCPIHNYGVGNCVQMVNSMTYRNFEKDNIWMIHSDGITRKVLEINSQRYFYKDELIEIHGLGRDVTERIKMERKIDRQINYLNMVDQIASLLSLDLLNTNIGMLFDQVSEILKKEYNLNFLEIVVLNDSNFIDSKVDEYLTKINKSKETIYFERDNSEHIYITPMSIKGKLLGYFVTNSIKELDNEYRYFSLSIGSLLASALDKSNLHENLKKLYVNTIRSLVYAVEAKDIYTKGHSSKVASYAVQIGKAMAFNEFEIEELEVAGLLHDIGKIGISDDILTKNGKLTEEEYEKVKQHPLIGKKILRPLGFSPRVIDCVMYHHLRYDKKGYPSIEKEDFDPIYANIVSVADAFDAMSSNRSYKSKYSIEQSINEIKNNINSQFCPNAANVLIDLLINGELELIDYEE
jgi:PAS domain S-box-containing protein/putative nucleotidyltransferase with HDIG domain